MRQRLSRHATTFAVRQLGGRQNRRPNLFRKELSEAFKCLKKLEKLQKQLILIEENLRVEKEKEQFRRDWDEALRRVYGDDALLKAEIGITAVAGQGISDSVNR